MLSESENQVIYQYVWTSARTVEWYLLKVAELRYFLMLDSINIAGLVIFLPS